MKTINLESIILEAYGCKDACDFQNSYYISMQMIKEICIEACKQTIELAAENAVIERDYEFSDNCWVNKKSILEVIKQIE